MAVIGSLVAALVGAAVGAAVAVTLLAKRAPACDTDLLRADVASMRAELVALRAKLVEAPPASAAPALDPAPAPSRVTLQIMSSPPGAEVVDADGRLLGRTPMTLTLPASTAPRAFTLRLDGYTDTAFQVTPNKDTTFTFALARR
jgi:hypothetical protein